MEEKVGQIEEKWIKDDKKGYFRQKRRAKNLTKNAEKSTFKAG